MYIWNWFNFNGKLTWDNSHLTIINANDTFCKYLDKADKFIKDECAKRNINIEYGLKLVEINKVRSKVNSGQTDHHLRGHQDWSTC